MQKGRCVGASSELLVAYRFTLSQRIVSWPLMPCAYDMLVDCGDTIQRVQVKTGRAVNATTWWVRLTRRMRDKRDQPILAASIDYVCVVCDPNRVYVIPTTAICSPSNPDQLCASVQIYENGDRLRPFLNAFAIGSGLGSGDVQPNLKVGWKPELQQPGPPTDRKPHQRLSIPVINEIRREAEGKRLTPAERRVLAARYDITLPTLRNYLQGNRKDLRPQVKS